MTKETRYYAGIGSRKTPEHVLAEMARLAKLLEKNNYTLRSGGAPGADIAFSNAVENSQIFVPWKGFGGFPKVFNIPEEAFEIASQIHPAWNKLPDSVKVLMARNSMQVLGPGLHSPSDFVICWTPDGATCAEETGFKTGGTGQAIRLASRNKIPVVNLEHQNAQIHLNKIGSMFEIKDLKEYQLWQQ